MPLRRCGMRIKKIQRWSKPEKKNCQKQGIYSVYAFEWMGWTNKLYQEI